ncbi:hypothetical protein VSR82_00025 [Burkholderia sp. JPY481]
MPVIVANFGEGNYFWPECRDKNIVATFEEKRQYELWLAEDKDGFIREAMRNSTTAAGKRPTKATATRWYNVTTIVSQSAGDLWLHLDRGGLWWTYSKSGEAIITSEVSHSWNADRPELVAI